ncbi:hypothetical protein PVAND_016582 [Polypedilum vanderplanki]|uniref:Uncharacterized protein n=1 Tax=Polypedilum vanderplanki TaxID=319348 RepID=A0A9J6BG74_POLVA|nr:hypothetical protein PVAND_016582 [Polypedilum vanderplanki]KAG5668648.1 hypothetical protein PVAND_016582 [Polypedilum vanderplanki]
MQKFLFFFPLEVGGFVIGMYGFTTSFMINAIISVFLYHMVCFSLFKIYALAAVVSYYMFASFMLVKEIFCDRRPSIVKHFLVIDVIVTIICLSGYIKMMELAPDFWPLYLVDLILRFYAMFTIYSLLVYYNENVRKSIASLSNQELEADPDVEKVLPVKHIRPVQGVLKIFDYFLGYMSLKASAFIFVFLNFSGSIGLMIYFLFFEKFNEVQLVIYIVSFVANTIMAISLIGAIKMRKSLMFIPGLILSLFEIFIFTYMLISSMLVVEPEPEIPVWKFQYITLEPGEQYDQYMKKFIDNINIPASLVLGVWYYMFLCLCSLYDVIKCEEREKRNMFAKESIAYGSIEDARRSSSL